jgi:hypothetical protein
MRARCICVEDAVVSPKKSAMEKKMLTQSAFPGTQWRNFGLKSGGDKNFGWLFGSVYSTARSLGRGNWLGWGMGARGSGGAPLAPPAGSGAEPQQLGVRG